jgi:hypothetical protein
MQHGHGCEISILVYIHFSRELRLQARLLWST